MIANPPPWPNGAKCAAAITFDLDADSSVHAHLPHDSWRRISTLSYFAYDQIAVPRIARTFEQLGIRQTFFIPAWCMDRYPQMVEDVLGAGQDLALHGHIHELAYEHPDADTEHEWLSRSIDTFVRRAGFRPVGWRAPTYGFSPHTGALLREEGITYDSSLMGDDVPYILQTAAGPVLELPVDWTNDDWPQYVQSFDFDYYSPIRSPDRAMEVFRAEIEAAREYGGMWIGVWHPAISGRLSRFKRIAALAEELRDAPDVWLATLGEIATYVDGLIAAGTWRPGVQPSPPYSGPVSEAIGATHRQTR